MALGIVVLRWSDLHRMKSVSIIIEESTRSRSIPRFVLSFLTEYPYRITEHHTEYQNIIEYLYRSNLLHFCLPFLSGKNDQKICAFHEINNSKLLLETSNCSDHSLDGWAGAIQDAQPVQSAWCIERSEKSDHRWSLSSHWSCAICDHSTIPLCTVVDDLSILRLAKFKKEPVLLIP